MYTWNGGFMSPGKAPWWMEIIAPFAAVVLFPLAIVAMLAERVRRAK